LLVSKSFLFLTHPFVLVKGKHLLLYCEKGNLYITKVPDYRFLLFDFHFLPDHNSFQYNQNPVEMYQAEAAKSNRSQCRETSCKQNIGVGELRIGFQGADYYNWYHAPCAFKSFTNRYIRNPKMTSTGDISNFDTLTEEHQNIIRELIDGTYVEPLPVRLNPRPKRKAAELNENQDVEQAESSRRPDLQKKKVAKKKFQG
jgi:hypothetical protein